MANKKWTLSPIKEEDLLLVLSWRNSPRIRMAMYTSQEISLNEHYAWFTRTQQPDYMGRHYLFYHQDRPIGVTNLSSVSLANKRLEWGCYLGEENVLKESAMIMGILALDIAFFEMKMHKVCGAALANNLRSLQFQKRLGFREEGVLKEHIYQNGAFLDVFSLGYLKNEWQNKRSKVVQELQKKFGFSVNEV